MTESETRDNSDEVNFKYYGVQTIFSTIPNQRGINFEEDVEKSYFSDYKEKFGADELLYNHLKFYMLGDYDVCYISLINNFKFSHRLFEPKSKVDNTVYNAHSFQNFSGIARNRYADLKSIFKKEVDTFFIGVINLKLNNGLLIGNGLEFIDAVNDKIKELLGDTKFLLTQTFSWFELSLVVFINDPAELAEILSKIRMAEFKDLDHDAFALSDSLYHDILKEELDILENISLFADTNTYFGFNAKLITNKLESPYIKQFKEYIERNNIVLESEIEWQVKPGHILHLERLLKESSYLSPYFNFDERKVVLGKCDYLLKEHSQDIMANFHLLRHLNFYRKNNCSLYDHIRKVRTYIFLDGKNFGGEVKVRKFFCWDKALDKLAVKSKDFEDIDSRLKSLKISRQVRIKILKVFSNYNNGIQDPILFPYFLDFTIFIRNLVKHIINQTDVAKTGIFSLKEFETDLNENIKVFQEGYDVRFLNAYQFENISDFDLDFNSSIQQLLTSYGTLVHEYGKLFYQKTKVPYGPLIQLNNIDTTSNYRCINYSIHHLTSPEFVFSTLLKEVLNHFRLDNDDLDAEFRKLDSHLTQILSQINESYLDDMMEHHLVDFEYLIIDSIRFIVTFNCNFPLFEHWFWSYNFQNPSLFDTSGMFNEDHLRKELLRILLVKKMYGAEDHLICPIPELATYWERHFEAVDRTAEHLADELKKYEFLETINAVVSTYLDNYPESDKNSLAIVEYMDKMERLTVITDHIKKKQRDKIELLIAESDSDNEVLNMERLLFDTLNTQYELNNKGVTLLKRNWESGVVLDKYDRLNSDKLYAIDQTGGVYFYDNEKVNLYFTNNAACLFSLIDFSLVKKKEFFLKQQKYA